LNTHAVTGEVTFLLCDEIYDNNTGEIFPIEINASPAYTVTFKPAPNKTVNINAYNINNWSSVRALFKLNGAKNIIFNGSGNEYDSKYLTLTNHCSIFNDSHRTIFRSEERRVGKECISQGRSHRDLSNVISDSS